MIMMCKKECFSGKEWTYKETRVETEYVWRNNNYSRHYANGYTSIPDALGEYQIDSYVDDEQVQHDGNEYNTFLEFYVYNVYEAKKYPVEIKKIDVTNIDDPDSGGLDGAVFDLYGPYAEERTTDDDGATGRQLILRQKDITVPENNGGVVSLGDLSDGYYYLYETQVPDGFIRPTEPIIIIVDSTQEAVQGGKAITYTQVGNSASANGPQVIEGEEGTDPTYRLLVTNNPGVALPYTGGSGTCLLYLCGALLILFSAAGVVVKKRREALQNKGFIWPAHVSRLLLYLVEESC